jgi:hypothetical protein
MPRIRGLLSVAFNPDVQIEQREAGVLVVLDNDFHGDP